MATHIYDPRDGRARSFSLSGKLVSLAEHDVWVLESTDRDWRVHAALIDRLMGMQAGHRYVTFLPWSPGTDLKRRTFQETFKTERAFGAGTIWLATHDDRITAGTVLEVRSQLGGGASGVWAVGSLSSTAAAVDLLRRAPPFVDSPIAMTAALSRDVLVALALDDGFDALFVKLLPEAVATVDVLQAALPRVS